MFIDKMQYEDIDMKSLGITTITKEQAINMLKNIYQ
jgi:hypothetical protein